MSLAECGIKPPFPGPGKWRESGRKCGAKARKWHGSREKIGILG
ncbi:MAG: hypothetical protein Q6370_021260 [Candidatus Sigynarchaeota archaeon]